MENIIKFIFGGVADKRVFEDLARGYDGIALAEAKKDSRGMYLAKKQYHQSLEFWQIVVVTLAARASVPVIQSIKEIILKYLDTTKSSIRIEKDGKVLQIDSSNLDDVKNLLHGLDDSGAGGHSEG